MNAAQAQRNALSQRIEQAFMNDKCSSSAVIKETTHVGSILWRSSGESEYGFRPEELVGLADRIRKLAPVLDIEITEDEIAACELDSN